MDNDIYKHPDLEWVFIHSDDLQQNMLTICASVKTVSVKSIAIIFSNILRLDCIPEVYKHQIVELFNRIYQACCNKYYDFCKYLPYYFKTGESYATYLIYDAAKNIPSDPTNLKLFYTLQIQDINELNATLKRDFDVGNRGVDVIEWTIVEKFIMPLLNYDWPTFIVNYKPN